MNINLNTKNSPENGFKAYKTWFNSLINETTDSDTHMTISILTNVSQSLCFVTNGPWKFQIVILPILKWQNHCCCYWELKFHVLRKCKFEIEWNNWAYFFPHAQNLADFSAERVRWKRCGRSLCCVKKFFGVFAGNESLIEVWRHRKDRVLCWCFASERDLCDGGELPAVFGLAQGPGDNEEYHQFLHQRPRTRIACWFLRCMCHGKRW